MMPKNVDSIGELDIIFYRKVKVNYLIINDVGHYPPTPIAQRRSSLQILFLAAPDFSIIRAAHVLSVPPFSFPPLPRALLGNYPALSLNEVVSFAETVLDISKTLQSLILDIDASLKKFSLPANGLPPPADSQSNRFDKEPQGPPGSSRA